jgi:hypothetical protein
MNVNEKIEVTEEIVFELLEGIMYSNAEKCNELIERRFKEVFLTWKLSDVCMGQIIETCKELMSEFATTSIFEVLHEKKAGDNKTISIY